MSTIVQLKIKNKQNPCHLQGSGLDYVNDEEP